MLASFVLAWGVVAFDGSMGAETTTTAQATTTTAATTDTTATATDTTTSSDDSTASVLLVVFGRRLDAQHEPV